MQNNRTTEQQNNRTTEQQSKYFIQKTNFRKHNRVSKENFATLSCSINIIVAP